MVKPGLPALTSEAFLPAVEPETTAQIDHYNASKLMFLTRKERIAVCGKHCYGQLLKRCSKCHRAIAVESLFIVQTSGQEDCQIQTLIYTR
ncbi:hypothetical protein pipiens_006399 [Culex pipiens pipiens]|uniref:Uncharacterized protein n=1 Tax=Culex pipiens pipiens TaxID=38569 RepID=A0ABD1DQM2_CULPP